MHVAGAGQMRLAVLASANGGVGEVEAGIEQQRRVRPFEQRAQRRGIDQRSGQRRLHDSSVELRESGGATDWRSRVAPMPAPTMSSMPATASGVTGSSNSNTP